MIGAVFLFDVMLLSMPSCLAYTDCTFAIHAANPLTYASWHHMPQMQQSSQADLSWWWICPEQSNKVLYAHLSTKEGQRRSVLEACSLFKYMYCILFGWWFQMLFIFTPSWGNDSIWLIFFKGVKPPTSHYEIMCAGLHYPMNHHFFLGLRVPPISRLSQGWKISKPCEKYDMFLSHTCPGSKESQRSRCFQNNNMYPPQIPPNYLNYELHGTYIQRNTN